MYEEPTPESVNILKIIMRSTLKEVFGDDVHTIKSWEYGALIRYTHVKYRSVHMQIDYVFESGNYYWLYIGFNYGVTRKNLKLIVNWMKKNIGYSLEWGRYLIDSSRSMGSFQYILIKCSLLISAFDKDGMKMYFSTIKRLIDQWHDSLLHWFPFIEVSNIHWLELNDLAFFDFEVYDTEYRFSDDDLSVVIGRPSVDLKSRNEYICKSYLMNKEWIKILNFTSLSNPRVQENSRLLYYRIMCHVALRQYAVAWNAYLELENIPATQREVDDATLFELKMRMLYSAGKVEGMRINLHKCQNQVRRHFWGFLVAVMDGNRQQAGLEFDKYYEFVGHDMFAIRLIHRML